MPKLKLSVTTSDFPMDLRGSLHQAMILGAQGVQLDLRNELNVRDYGETARRQLLHYLAERNLEAASAVFPLRSPLADPDHLDERTQAVKQALVFAGQLKIRRLCLRIGRLPVADDVQALAQLRDIFSELANCGDREGVTLCLKPAGDPPGPLREFLESIRTAWVAVDADLGGWILNRQSPTQMLRELNDRIHHVEVRDAVRNVDGLGKEVPVGRGEVDWEEAAALLSEMDYRGWLNVTRSEGNDRTGDIDRATQYLRNLLMWES